MDMDGDAPYMVKTDELFEDLREVFKKHGWDASDAYDLAMEAMKLALRK